MNGSRRRPGRAIAVYARRHAIAIAALWVGVAGTAYAAATVGSPEVINESLRSVDLRNDSIGSVDVRNDDRPGGGLTGVDVGADRLGDRAVNAGALTGFARRCQGQAVLGAARIEGGGVIPPQFVGSPFVATQFNCSFGEIEVRRANPGVYHVCFPSFVGELTAIASATHSGEASAGEDNFATVRNISDAGCPPSGPPHTVQVQIRDEGPGAATLEDGNFNLIFLDG